MAFIRDITAFMAISLIIGYSFMMFLTGGY